MNREMTSAHRPLAETLTYDLPLLPLTSELGHEARAVIPLWCCHWERWISMTSDIVRNSDASRPDPRRFFATAHSSLSTWYIKITLLLPRGALKWLRDDEGRAFEQMLVKSREPATAGSWRWSACVLLLHVITAYYNATTRRTGPAQ